MEKPFAVLPGVHVLPAFFPLPGIGFLAVNAFVIEAREPVLVDTGMRIEGEAFLRAIESIIDPRDIRWIWLTHDDADHAGNLRTLLDAAPRATLVANSLAVLRLSTLWPLPMERVRWMNPGDTLSAGDRRLTAVRPPIFDNPTTIAVFDDASKALFTADLFGGILPSPARVAEDVPLETLAQGLAGWASADSPWLHMIEPERFARMLDPLRRLDPAAVLSAHLPPAQGAMFEQLLGWLAQVPAAEPFVTPAQSELEQILAQMRATG